jgi:hypothetical protein
MEGGNGQAGEQEIGESKRREAVNLLAFINAMGFSGSASYDTPGRSAGRGAILFIFASVNKARMQPATWGWSEKIAAIKPKERVEERDRDGGHILPLHGGCADGA